VVVEVVDEVDEVVGGSDVVVVDDRGTVVVPRACACGRPDGTVK
jgi:hypothetical protein